MSDEQTVEVPEEEVKEETNESGEEKVEEVGE